MGSSEPATGSKRRPSSLHKINTHTLSYLVPRLCSSAGNPNPETHEPRDEAEVAAPALGEPMDLMTALQLVMKKSLAHDGLVRGLHEAAKAIEKHAAQLCILAEDCNQTDYVKLVKALCADHNVHLVTVPSAKTLGEWAGLCKIDSEGKARKVVGCSCVVVKDYGEESEGLHIVQEVSVDLFSQESGTEALPTHLLPRRIYIATQLFTEISAPRRKSEFQNPHLGGKKAILLTFLGFSSLVGSPFRSDVDDIVEIS
ncbi:40S ribosomal protein S12-like [Canna indica]|uniref:40S ribosomal protein S12 n=1 Tax=Canna indica TaxID=4628 RepID=A0AAQ3KVY0_9LILI|nr:40S ribosomal protein S12-like [Canna indica]